MSLKTSPYKTGYKQFPDTARLHVYKQGAQAYAGWVGGVFDRATQPRKAAVQVAEQYGAGRYIVVGRNGGAWVFDIDATPPVPQHTVTSINGTHF